MSLNPINEVRYRYRLARQNLTRAERLYKLGDWAGTVQSAQLAIENFTKTLIALFEIPTWSHDPSNQLLNLIGRFPNNVIDEIRELADLAREYAVEHSRSTYGEPDKGLTPDELYGEGDAHRILIKAYRAQNIVNEVLKILNISIS